MNPLHASAHVTKLMRTRARIEFSVQLKTPESHPAYASSFYCGLAYPVERGVASHFTGNALNRAAANVLSRTSGRLWFTAGWTVG